MLGQDGDPLESLAVNDKELEQIDARPVVEVTDPADIDEQSLGPALKAQVEGDGVQQPRESPTVLLPVGTDHERRRWDKECGRGHAPIHVVRTRGSCQCVRDDTHGPRERATAQRGRANAYRPH